MTGKKVIVAEDDENSFFLLEYILNENKIKIIHTETGEETIHVALENPDVSVILMDIRMPGMNGLEAARKIREFNSGVPIIAQTALVFNDEEKLIFESGCTDFILKPIDQTLLVDKLQNAVKLNPCYSSTL